MHTATAAIVAAALLAGCRLDPLVPDTPGASVNVLPPGAVVPGASRELSDQIALNDGLDGNLVPLGTGQSEERAVGFWALGPGSRAPSLLYEFFTAGGARLDSGAVPLEQRHPPLVDTVPGDRGYNPLHAVFRVEVTGTYQGQRITTPEALADAVDLGLVSEPLPTGNFVTLAVVLPDVRLEVNDQGASVPPEPLYARGHLVAGFRFGGELGVQPGTGLLPALQVSFLRERRQPFHDASRPIFQATIPMTAPSEEANYTALSTVVLVDLADNAMAASIQSDAHLFQRDPLTGAITGITDAVDRFEVTTTELVLQLQLSEGKP
jgi:hypothetical protein